MRYRLAVDDAKITVTEGEYGGWFAEFYWPDGSCAWTDAWKGDKHSHGTERAAKEDAADTYRVRTGHLWGKRAKWIKEEDE